MYMKLDSDKLFGKQVEKGRFICYNDEQMLLARRGTINKMG